MNFRVAIEQNGERFDTLSDILPVNSGKLEILFIAKTPAPKSVEIGHYFQGTQGKMFWNKLIEYKILTIRLGTYEDENLLENNYGITDIVKKPREFGNEPSPSEYKFGLARIQRVIKNHRPTVLVFVYKKVLDNILRWGHDVKLKSVYGFNPDLESHFGSKVFVFPMPGTPCKSEVAVKAMIELQLLIRTT
jgi:hypothetical protein